MNANTWQRIAAATAAVLLFAGWGSAPGTASDVYDGMTKELGWPDPPMKSGYHLFFDGVDDVITIGPFPPVGISTVEVWVRPRHDGPAQEGAVIVNGGGPRAYCGTGIGIFAAKRELCYETDPAGCGNDVDICIHYNTDAQWVHIAGTYDGETSRIYINGKLLHSKDGIRFDPGDWMTLGAYQYFNGNQGFYKGELDEVRVWSVVRSEEEIHAHMFEPLTGKEEGLIAYWNFDEGGGDRSVNKAGDGHDAYLGGMSRERTDVPKWVPSGNPSGSQGFDGRSAPLHY